MISEYHICSEKICLTQLSPPHLAFTTFDSISLDFYSMANSMPEPDLGKFSRNSIIAIYINTFAEKPQQSTEPVKGMTRHSAPQPKFERRVNETTEQFMTRVNEEVAELVLESHHQEVNEVSKSRLLI